MEIWSRGSVPVTREAAFIQIGRALICIVIGGYWAYTAILSGDWLACALFSGVCLMMAYFIYKAAKIIRETGRPANRS